MEQENVQHLSEVGFFKQASAPTGALREICSPLLLHTGSVLEILPDNPSPAVSACPLKRFCSAYSLVPFLSTLLVIAFQRNLYYCVCFPIAEGTFTGLPN